MDLNQILFMEQIVHNLWFDIMIESSYVWWQESPIILNILLNTLNLFIQYKTSHQKIHNVYLWMIGINYMTRKYILNKIPDTKMKAIM